MAMHPARQAYIEDEPNDEDEEMEGISLADVPLDHDHYVPDSDTGLPSQKASTLIAELDRKRRADQLIVPTSEREVKARLRSLGEPITLFAEDASDRRDRLRQLLLRQAESAGGDVDVVMEDAGEADKDEEGEFYTRGLAGLQEARRNMAQFSFPRAKKRVAFQKIESTIPLKKHVEFRSRIKERASNFELYGSQIASERPVGLVRFSPNGKYVATGTFAGQLKLLDVPTLEERLVYKYAHTDRTTGIDWFPGATVADSGVSNSSLNLASGGGGGKIQFWSLESNTPLATLSGHTDRVCRLAFHPSGRYLVSGSEDNTWRLWDVENQKELLVQEGHSAGVFAVNFNSDGSLLASAGLDSIGRIWDIRTGRIAFIMESHIKPIYGVDWSTDGVRVLSGSMDGFMKCWDIRNMRESNSIGANSGGVMDLKWFKGCDGPTSGVPLRRDEQGELVPKKASTIVISSGFDKTVKVFSADDWALCKTLKGHDGHVLSTDMTNDGTWICSSGRDRTVKLWARDDNETI